MINAVLVLLNHKAEQYNVRNIIHSLKNSSAGHDEFPTFVGKRRIAI